MNAYSLSIHDSMPTRQVAAPEYFVRAGIFDGFFELLAELGVDALTVLQDAGIQAAALVNPEVRIPSLAYRLAMKLAAERSGLEHFGIALAQRQRLATIGPLGAAVGEARDVRHGIELLNTFLRVQTEGSFAHLEVRDDLATWTFTLMHPEAPGGREAEDHGVAFGGIILRRLIRSDWAPYYVALPRAAPRDERPYRQFFGCKLLFDAESAHAGFDPAVLRMRNQAADADVQAVLVDYLRELAATVRSGAEGRLERVLAQAVMQGDCSMESVARTLGLSVRSLQRRLAEDGTKFQAELDRVRAGLASKYLRESNMTMTALADMLGYADVSSFSRAFKRTRGLSPLAWRRQQSA